MSLPVRSFTGVVVSAGLMQKTVKVRAAEQVWDKHIRKHFTRPKHQLVHDPASSLLAGDIISFTSGYRTSKHVHHVVTSILAPFEKPIEARPPVWTAEQREAVREEKRAAKVERRRIRDGLIGNKENATEEKLSPEQVSAKITDHAKGFAEKAVENETEARRIGAETGKVDEEIRKERTGG